ncbi:hypothetical protein K440DRAFT_10561 [Wilcoxina mikolae CBS 423.85]|nr:hypothetical protein K440DRAFT_10561 [Wilcoxina mikolae CBS 423.85]
MCVVSVRYCWPWFLGDWCWCVSSQVNPTSIPQPEDFHNGTTFGDVSAICGKRCEVASATMVGILCFMVPFFAKLLLRQCWEYFASWFLLMWLRVGFEGLVVCLILAFFAVFTRYC